MDFAQKPQLTPNVELRPGVRLSRLWTGPGLPPLEVGELSAPALPSDTVLRECWQGRLRGRAVPLLLFFDDNGEVTLCGPDQGPRGEPAGIARMPRAAAEVILHQVLAVPAHEAVGAYLSAVARTQGTGGVPGLRNRQLLSTHYLTSALQRQHAGEWADWSRQAQCLSGTTGAALFRRLGYSVDARPRGELFLGVGGQPVAVAHVYPPHSNLDRLLTGPSGQRVHPAALALAAAAAQRVEYAFLQAGSVLRLHRVRPAEAFEESAAPAAFVEFDLSLLPADHFGVVWAVCAAEALAPTGRMETLFAEAERYAVGLRQRFRDRVYGEVVQTLARGLWVASRRLPEPPVADAVYRATLVLLFRLLFVLYAEDRNLMPMRNPRYEERSLTRRAASMLPTYRKGSEAFEERQADLWDDVRRVFGGVRAGHREWGLPPYDGGLFEDTGTPEAELLAAVRLPNRVVGPALCALVFDQDPEQEGKVDFGDLGVRHLGDLYEGLLSYRAAVAEVDLTVNRRQAGEPYLPAGPGDVVEVHAGELYFTSPQGGRKATGSYFTPGFAVNRLAEGALEPVLARHLQRLDELSDETAATAFFDLKVCDPAMGSAHFLTRALDLIAERLQAYLVRRPLPALAAELERARHQIADIGRQYGAQELGEGASDFDLLRRLVLKRCIYGVDINPLAVELAKLSLWLRAFVPGLPLSFLDHTLRCGDALVGVVGPELVTTLNREYPMIRDLVMPGLNAALDEARTLGGIDDLELHEVQRSRELQAQIEASAAPARDLYDGYTACGFDPELRWTNLLAAFRPGEGLGGLPAAWRACIERARDTWSPVQWTLAYPEVFLRKPGGFDAVLGNPPWEEVTVEQLGFFTRYIPGLKSDRSPARQAAVIAAFCARHPDIAAEFQAEQQRTQDLRGYIHTAYKLTRSGDPDLYRAFCERFLQLLRPGGSLGVVLPRTAFSGDGTAPFRQALFSGARQVQLDFLLNSGGWVFPEAEHRYTVTLTLLTGYGTGDGETVISVAGPADDEAAFAGIDAERVDWTLEELRKASDGMEVPMIPGHRAAALFRRLVATHPRFDSDAEGFQPVPWRELDATNDRKSGLLREGGEGWPVYTGDSFDLWNPDLRQPVQVVPPKDGLAELQRKRQRSKVWRGHLPPRVLADPATLPQHHARILFRDVTRKDDSRTVRACLVPPRVFAINTAPSLVFPCGNIEDTLYVLGIMGSVPFDWCARRRVESHMNFFILNPLPMPRPPRDSQLRASIARTAGRLACIDDRFAEVAEALGVPCGPLAPEDKTDLIAQLDALAARAFGLSEDELQLIFEDFPATEAGVSEARRAATLEHFRRLATMPA